MRFLTLSVTTFLGIGYLPIMPGTYASLSVIITYSFALGETSFYFQISIILFLFLIGTIFSTKAETIFDKKDPKPVVIDEVVGQMISVFLVSSRILPLAIGFILFRVFDVLKPFPCFQAQKMKGGLGVMLDDVFAGIWANLILRVIMKIFEI